MFLYAVVLFKLWGYCEKFSKFCHEELASVQEVYNFVNTHYIRDKLEVCIVYNMYMYHVT